MRTIRRFLGLAGASVLAAGLPAVAGDVTISDGIPDSAPFGPGGQVAPSGFLEDQTVESGATADQTWDLEAFVAPGGGLLNVVAGFDMKSGSASGGNTSPMGDIFIKVGAGTINPTSLTSAGYTYVVHFTSFTELSPTKAIIPGTTVGTGIGNVTYSIYAASAVGVINTGTIHITPGGALFSNLAWQANVTGATPVKTGTADYVDNVGDAASGGYAGGNHDIISGINLNGLGILSTDSVSAWTTMGCGNDGIIGGTVGVTLFGLPDGGATAVLLGAGLVGLGMVRRRIE